jgi:hypothetical protein
MRLAILQSFYPAIAGISYLTDVSHKTGSLVETFIKILLESLTLQL